MTQEQRILKHLKDYKHITSWEAIMEYGVTRISARIFNLKKQGYKIKTERISTKNRYGDSVSFAKYILEEK